MLEVLPRANRAPRTPVPSPAYLHASAKTLHSTSRAVRASALTPTARRGQCSPPPRATHSQAEPQGCTDACHTFQEPQVIPEDAEGSQSATTLMRRHDARLLQPVHTAATAPARACQPQAPRDQAQQSARRGSQCTPANCSPECAPAPPSAVRRRAEPERAAPSRRHTQTRATPFTSRADHQKPSRSARRCAP
jgi:hypothetical protein